VKEKRSCVVLAGGFGTRLREAVPDRPKCLAPVGARSFLEIHLDSLAGQGVDRFVLSLGHMAEMVIAAIEPLRTRYHIDCVIEESPLGTGGAVCYAMHQVGLDEAMLTNGDTFLDADLSDLMTPLALNAGERMRLAAVKVDDRSRFGGITLANRLVTGFLEKGAAGAGLINAGVYRVHRSAFGNRAPGDVFSLETDVMPQLVQTGALKATVVLGSFIDIGVPLDYRRFCDEHA